MATFRPCIGCIARYDCSIKKDVMAAIRGQPITSVKIKCNLPFTRDFPPGSRVQVTVWDADDYDGYSGEQRGRLAPATVVGPSTKKAGKLLLHLDTAVKFSDDSSSEFRAAWPREVNKLDEPIRPACSSCKRAYVHDKCNCSEDE